jgi:hypothetical protein
VLKRVETGSSSQRDAAAAPLPGNAFARHEIYRDFASAETLWRALEKDADLTPYQRHDFLRLWHEHVGVKEGVSPLITVAFRVSPKKAKAEMKACQF